MADLLPDQSSAVPDVTWKAVARATYDQAVQIMEDPPKLGTMRDLFDHRLGTFGQAYHVEGYVQVYKENERLREALEEIAAYRSGNPTPRVIAEAALAGPSLDVRCGHAEGDHQSNKSPTSPRHGICLITGCDCQQYQPAGGGFISAEPLLASRVAPAARRSPSPSPLEAAA